jgi:hypothetical protein
MALSRNQMIVSSVFLVIAMGTVATMYYRATTGGFEERRKEYQQRADAAQPIRKTTVLSDRVVLIKDEPLVVERVQVVYRGMSDGRIHLDVYLLDLDPNYPYARHLTKDEARKSIHLGSRFYRLHAVNQKSLTLLFAN